jgi:SNF2 family DNA or RNA helicase
MENLTIKQKLLLNIVANHIRDCNNDYFVSFGNKKIEYSHYQYRPLCKLLKNELDGLLVADDVGIGKTIETGIIIKEMMYKNNYNRILIICPSELVGK